MRNLSGILGTCSLLLLSATLAAQAPSAQGASDAAVLASLKERIATLRAVAPATGACPVGFSARHADVGAMLNVSPATKPSGPAYNLRFVPRDGGAITQAKITLHGISGHHVIPAGNGPHAASNETSEAFTLALSSDGRDLFTSVVYPGKLTGVTSVELNELTYADGTKWHETAGARCEIAQNGYMLVAGS